METLRLLQCFSIAACLFFLPFSAAAAAEKPANVTNNPADQLASLLNTNRTNHHLKSLYDNPGLACIALQYIKSYNGDCRHGKPDDSDITSSFAPTCGVEVATMSEITGRLLACQEDYVSPSEAFSNILMKSGETMDVLHSSNHTEFGAAVSGSGKGGPYFWCVLFSDGKPPNSSFVLEDGAPKSTKPGCFSGANDECSGVGRLGVGLSLWFSIVVGVFVVSDYYVSGV